MNDICCIGHITLDKIVTPKQTAYMPGGTSYPKFRSILV